MQPFRQEMRSWTFAAALTIALIGLAGSLYAQEPNPSPSPVAALGQQVIELATSVAGLVIAFGVPALVLWFKRFEPPKWVVPIIAATLGVIIDLLLSLRPGGEWAPVAAVSLVGLVNLLRGVIANFSAGVASKALAILLSFSLGLAGCAHQDKIRHSTALSIKTAQTALAMADELEYSLQCGAAKAPPEPYCVGPEKHRELSKLFVKGFTLVERGGELYLAWDTACAEASKKGEVCKPTPTEIAVLALQAAALVREIIAGLPDSKPKEQLLKHQSVQAVQRAALAY